MITNKEWNERQKHLRNIIYQKKFFEETKNLLMQLHSQVYPKDLYHLSEDTNLDLLYDGLSEDSWQIMPTKKDVTIIWDLWHITRIEDITMNLLVMNQSQVLDTSWSQRLKTSVTDTGNAMTDEKIIEFSQAIDIEVFKAYRNTVGKQSQEFLMQCSFEDIKRKFTAQQVQRIIEEKAVTEDEDSIWLADFWGKKNVGGILLLPLTRHQNSHLNDALRLKKKLQK